MKVKVAAPVKKAENKVIDSGHGVLFFNCIINEGLVISLACKY
jgi:hypothetical protein